MHFAISSDSATSTVQTQYCRGKCRNFPKNPILGMDCDVVNPKQTAEAHHKEATDGDKSRGDNHACDPVMFALIQCRFVEVRPGSGQARMEPQGAQVAHVEKSSHAQDLLGCVKEALRILTVSGSSYFQQTRISVLLSLIGHGQPAKLRSHPYLEMHVRLLRLEIVLLFQNRTFPRHCYASLAALSGSISTSKTDAISAPAYSLSPEARTSCVGQCAQILDGPNFTFFHNESIRRLRFAIINRLLNSKYLPRAFHHQPASRGARRAILIEARSTANSKERFGRWAVHGVLISSRQKGAIREIYFSEQQAENS